MTLHENRELSFSLNSRDWFGTNQFHLFLFAIKNALLLLV